MILWNLKIYDRIIIRLKLLNTKKIFSTIYFSYISAQLFKPLYFINQ